MKIPSDAIIADEKLTDYLLVPKLRNDKSKFLAGAGFTPANPEALRNAIRALADQAEAVPEKVTEYGTAYHVQGKLLGPGKRTVSVVLVWFQRSADNKFYFVTLKPSQRGNQ